MPVGDDGGSETSSGGNAPGRSPYLPSGLNDDRESTTSTWQPLEAGVNVLPLAEATVTLALVETDEDRAAALRLGGAPARRGEHGTFPSYRRFQDGLA